MSNNINFNIEVIIDEYSNYVFKIINNIVGTSLSYQDKEEMISDVFYLLWKNQNNINKDIKSYLGVITRNCAYSRLRTIKNNLEYNDVLSTDECMQDYWKRQEYVFMIKQKIANLTVNEQKIFYLYYVQGYRIREIAQNLNIKPTRVKVTLFRIRKKLREDIK